MTATSERLPCAACDGSRVRRTMAGPYPCPDCTAPVTCSAITNEHDSPTVRRMSSAPPGPSALDEAIISARDVAEGLQVGPASEHLARVASQIRNDLATASLSAESIREILVAALLEKRPVSAEDARDLAAAFDDLGAAHEHMRRLAAALGGGR